MSDEENNPKSIMLPSEEERHGWKQHAGFSIFFDYKLDENGHKHWHTRIWKTTTYHEESGDVKELDGIDTRKWVDWIIDKAGLELDYSALQQGNLIVPSATDAEAQQTEQLPVVMEIEPVEAYPSPERGKQTMLADIHLQLSGDGLGKLLTARAPFQVEMHLINLQSGVSTLAGITRQQFEPSKLKYTIAMEFPVPEELGRYELQTVAFLFPPNKYLFFRDGDTFKVIP